VRTLLLIKQLLSDLELLDPSTWNVDATIVDGDPAITRLCRRFKLDERTAIDGFRDFFESSSAKVPEKLVPLRRAVECLVVSTAECEPSFSAVNDIASDTRSSLGVKRISALMFAKSLDPKDIIAFNSESYVRKWLAGGRHSADDTASRKRDTTKLQPSDYSHLYEMCSNDKWC